MERVDRDARDRDAHEVDAALAAQSVRELLGLAVQDR
jgi:hypothetical protein